MIKLLLIVWLGGVATLVANLYRESPAEALEQLRLYEGEATAAAGCKDWKTCIRAYQDALARCPGDDTTRRMRLQLALAIARIHDDQLPRMRTELTALLREAEAGGVPAELVEDIRFALAKASYDLAWQLRLAGAHPDLWRESSATASQHFRLLAHEAMREGTARTIDYQRYLESSINLARIDLTILAGMPLPPNCWSNSNCEGKALRERERLGRSKPGENDQPKPNENQQKDARAGLGPQNREGR